jgi:hypothetical protein
VRSTTHGISIDHDAKQFHRDYLDLLLLLNQVKRREDNKNLVIQIALNVVYNFMLILFCLIKKYSKNQDSLLFNANSTFYSTIESRPQALWILTVS